MSHNTPNIQFECDQCGLCCCNVDHIDELESIDGVCIQYDKDSKSCKIYETRPMICRVIEGFESLGINEIMTMDEYILANMDACKEFKTRERNKNVELD